MDKPRSIPKELLGASLAGSALLVVYAALLWVVPAGFALWVLHADLALAWQLPIIAALCLLGSFGLGLFLWLGHEGGHGNMHPDPFVSNVIGILCSFPVAPQSAIGFSASHLDHHRFANREGDPNLEIYRPYRSFWARMLLSPTRATRKYKELTRMLVRREVLPFRTNLPFDQEQLRRLARLNRGVQASWALSVLGGLIIAPLETAVAYLIPGFISRCYNGVRPYMEHSALGDEDGRESRDRCSWLWTVLEAGNNFHQEHHLYPGVPCYRLPALHRYLREQGFYEGAENLEPSFAAAFRYAGARARLPGQ